MKIGMIGWPCGRPLTLLNKDSLKKVKIKKVKKVKDLKRQNNKDSNTEQPRNNFLN